MFNFEDSFFSKKHSVLLSFLVFLMICAFMAVSLIACSSDSSDSVMDKTGTLIVNADNLSFEDSKGLNVTVSNNVTTDGTGAYYWRYTAVKKDSYGKTGEKTAETVINGGSKGLPATLSNMSVGKWEITLYGYLTTGYANADIVYQSEPVPVEIKANATNNIMVSVHRVQKAGTKGKLVIDPAQISVAFNSGTIAVTKTYETGDDNVYLDGEAYVNMFGKLSEYTYKIYECNEDWSVKSTLINSTADKAANGQVSTYTNANAEVGTHYIKIEVVRDGYNHAEEYLALMRVEVYSNCTTTVQNDGDGDFSGITVKRIKEFRVTYYNWGASDNLPFTGKHGQVYTGELREDGTPKITSHTQTHQYGRTEALDDPEDETGNTGFAGYYTTYNGNVLWTSIPAWEYQDIKLYAKWDVKKYASITWNDNFPAKAVSAGTTTAHTGGSSSTADAGTVPVMPTDPKAVGYTFKGWYIDGAHYGYTNANGLPAAWKAGQSVVCVAQWEPIHYYVQVKLGKPFTSGGGTVAINATNVTNLAELLEQKDFLENTGLDYDEEYTIIDAITPGYGFVGYHKDTDVYEEGNMYTDPVLKNLTTEGRSKNNPLVYYAVFSDYFTPLEYIRSYTSADGTTGQHIDTLLNSSSAPRIKMSVEFSGSNERANRALIFSNYQYNNPVIFINGDGYWYLYDNKVSPSAMPGGMWFYDEKYDVDIETKATGQNLSINGETILTRGANTVENSRIYLFGASTNFHKTDMRLYSCLMYNASGDVIRRFQPCVLKDTVPAAFSSDGVGTHTTGEAGLWDLKTNKFYPNRGSGRFYQPSDEVTITLKNHDNSTNAEIQSDRRQRILKTSVLSGGEKLHINIFSKSNSSFLGWGNTYNATLNAYTEGSTITSNVDKTLYARWSNPISYNLFGEVQYLDFENGAFIGTQEYMRSEGVILEFKYRVNKFGTVQTWQGFFGTRANNNNPRGMSMGIFFHNTSQYLHAPFADGASSITGHPVGVDCMLKLDYTTRKLESTYGTDATRSYNLYTAKTFLCGPVLIGAVNELSATNITMADAGNVYVSGDAKRATGCYSDPAYPYFVSKDHQTGGTSFRLYYCKSSEGGIDLMDLHPAVLKYDLTSSTEVYDGKGNKVVGNTKVYGGYDCYAGECGLWDYVNDVFFSYLHGVGKYGVSEFVIRYDANGGLGNMQNQVITSSSDASSSLSDNINDERLKENRFDRPGYEFVGWCTMPDPTLPGAKWYSDERVLHKKELDNMTLFAQWRAVPATKPYTELEYIQNEGPTPSPSANGIANRAYINTGYTSSQNFRMFIRYNLVDDIATCFFGGDSSNYDLALYNNGAYLVYNSPRYTGIGQSVGKILEADGGRYNGFIDFAHNAYGSAKGSSILRYTDVDSVTKVSGGKVMLFARSYNHVSDKGRTKIYAFKLWDNSEKLVRDFIPVILNSNIVAAQAWDNKAHTAGELGMWDKCEGKFYSNANSTGYFSNDKLQILQFYPNGGTGTMSNQAFFVSTEKNAIKANTFKNGTKRFIGWNTKADGTGTWYHDKYDTNAWKGGVIQLYAMWDNSTYSGISVETVNTDYFEPVNYIYMPGSVGLDTGYSAAAADVYPLTFNARFIETVKANYTNLVRIMDGVRGFRLYMRNTSSHNYMRVDWYSVQEPTALETSAINTMRDIKVSVPSTSGNASINMNGSSASLAPNGVNTGTQNSVYFFWSSDGGNLYLKVYGFEMIAGENKGVFVPCRLKKNLTLYNSGALSFDGKTHKEGECGFWDLVTNKFMTNANGFTGTFTSEFE